MVGLAPPGPPGRFLGGNLQEFKRDPLAFLTRIARDYGDVAVLRLGPRRIVLLSHPDLVEQVLVSEARDFTKHFARRFNRLLLGNGLLSSEGDFWLRQRRLVQPAFNRPSLAGYAPPVVTFTERRVAGWRDGDSFDLHAEMMGLALDVVAKTLFDAEVAGEAAGIGTSLEIAMDSFMARLNSVIPIPATIPTPNNLRLWRAVQRLDEIIYRFIRKRRASGEDRGDLLSILLRARDEDDGSHMTDQQLRDEAMTLFLAGYETTALALTWTWYLLACHPEVEAQLLEEVKSVLGGRAPTFDDVPRLKLTERIVMESMRLYPPAYIIGRQPITDVVIGGYRVPAGRTIWMSQWVTHRDPRFFDRPEEFRPDRWAGGVPGRLPKYAYFPFGGGPRICVGNTFAMMELTLILATMAPQVRFELDLIHPVRPQASFTLRPLGGIRVKVVKR